MSSSPEPVDERIKIRVANQKAYLWDLNDIQKLRVQHHICGSLQGTLPQVTQQNVFLGLPLVLLPEEVVLLVKNQIAVLIDEPTAHLSPTLSQSSSYSKSRSSAIESQQKTTYEYETRKAAEMKSLHADKIEKKRRLKQEKALKQQRQDGFEVFVPDIPQGKENTGPPSILEEEGEQREPTKEELAKIPYTILIDPTSSPYPWYDPTLPEATCATLEEARDKKVWSYPREGNRLEESKCKVFEDLWRKGFYMGGGLRFGGDFLVYPGDPLRYHSHFTLTILSTPTTSVMPLDLVAYGRLATAVKKSHLLASWNEEKGEAEYLSLEWAAFG